MDKHAYKSSQREKLIEHLFIGELLKINWLGKGPDLEISKPEVDSAGYDFVAEIGDIIRHIQLKATKIGARAVSQNCHLALGNKPSGCVVWIYFTEGTLSLGPFLYYGGDPKQRLPDICGFKITKHARANAQGIKSERPDHRRIPKSKFARFSTIQEIYEKLFCPIAPSF